MGRKQAHCFLCSPSAHKDFYLIGFNGLCSLDACSESQWNYYLL